MKKDFFVKNLLMFWVLSMLFLPTPSAFAIPGYSLVDLGKGVAFDINNEGQVVGEGGQGRAFVWGNGVMTDLGTLGGGYSVAYGINDYGQVVGGGQNSLGQMEAFLWENGTMRGLGVLGGQGASDSAYSIARDINNWGRIVGEGDWLSVAGNSFYYDSGEWHHLSIEGNNNSRANGVNDNGDIVGAALRDSFRPYIFTNGSYDRLDLAGSGAFDLWEANDINNSGQVIGGALNSNDGFFWDNGTLTFLDGVALGLNDSGQVVGKGASGAFLWQDGLTTDLNSLIDHPDFWLQEAYGINELGQIVGVGLFEGERHAFLLNPGIVAYPVPEPSALVLFLLGSPAVLFLRLRSFKGK